MKNTTACRVFPTLLPVLLLCGCISGPYDTIDGNNNPGPGGGAVDDNVPALPMGGETATENLLALSGSQTFQAIGSSEADGAKLVLDASESSVSSWAIYEFTSVTDTLFPVRIKCYVTDDSGEYYLMYGHYNPDSWEIDGPYTGDAAFTFPDFVDLVSETGQTYITVVVPAGSSVTVEYLILEFSGLPSDGTGVDNYLPALPAGTDPATASSLSFTGSQTYLNSAEAVPVGNSLRLDAVGQQSSSWAIYEFSSVDLQFYPDSVTVSASDVGGEWFLMYGHYDPDSWELAGPYSDTSVTWEFPSHVQMRSPGNHTYVAVVASGGNYLTVDTVMLNLGSGPSPGTSVDDYVIALPDGLADAGADLLSVDGSSNYEGEFASIEGASLVLDAIGIQQSAWAVYEFTSADPALYQQTVEIDVSSDSDFYYVLWANYSASSWEMVVRPGATAGDPTRNQITGDFTFNYVPGVDSLSAGGRTYVAVIAQAGTRVVVNGLTLTVADTPPPAL